MQAPTLRALDNLAHQIATRYLEEACSELAPDRRGQLLALYHQALLRVFHEVALEPISHEPGQAMKIAARVHARTFGVQHDQVLAQVEYAPTPTVKALCTAIEKGLGKDLLVLKQAKPGPLPVPVHPTPSAASLVPPAPSPVPTWAVLPTTPAPMPIQAAPAPAVVPAPVPVVPAVTAAVIAAVTAAAPVAPKESPMATPAQTPTLTHKLSNEAAEAAWLVFAAKSTEITQQTISSFLQRNLADGDPALRARIGQLMETQLGEVITALLLSGVASSLGGTIGPKVGISADRMETLASKLRVHAMVSGGSALLGELVDPMVAGIGELLRSMPEAPAPVMFNPPRMATPEVMSKEQVASKVA